MPNAAQLKWPYHQSLFCTAGSATPIMAEAPMLKFRQNTNETAATAMHMTRTPR